MKYTLVVFIALFALSQISHSSNNNPFFKPEKPMIHLQAVATSKTKKACLLKTSKEIVYGTIGDHIEDFIISDITQTSVTLSNNKQCITLTCS